MSEFIEVTILVPIKDVKITDSKVERELGDRDTPAGYDVDVWGVEVVGLDYKISDFEDSNEYLLNKAIEEWKEL